MVGCAGQRCLCESVVRLASSRRNDTPHSRRVARSNRCRCAFDRVSLLEERLTMDPRAHTPTQDRESHSLYGFDMTEYLRGDAHAGQPACDVALHAVTHGGIYPLGQARLALGAYERAALDVLQRHRELRIDGDAPADIAGGTTL